MATLDDIALPEDLLWADEYAYTPVKQSTSTAVDGSLIVEAAAALKGRTMILQGGADYAWIDRATLELLRDKQYTPGLVMTLNLRGSEYSVLFVQPGGIEAVPVIDYSNPEADDFYTVTLKFIEV